MSTRRPVLAKRIAWFVALYVGGAATMALTAYLLRLLLFAVGLPRH